MESTSSFDYRILLDVYDTPANSSYEKMPDKYTLELGSDSHLSFIYVPTKATRLGTRSEIQTINQEDIPRNISQTMQKFIDDSVLSWETNQTTDQDDVGSVSGSLKITTEDNSEYLVKIHTADTAEVFEDGQAVLEEDLPGQVRNLVEKFTPESLNIVPRE